MQHQVPIVVRRIGSSSVRHVGSLDLLRHFLAFATTRSGILSFARSPSYAFRYTRRRWGRPRSGHSVSNSSDCGQSYLTTQLTIPERIVRGSVPRTTLAEPLLMVYPCVPIVTSSLPLDPPSARKVSDRSMSSVRYDALRAVRMNLCLSSSLADGRYMSVQEIRLLTARGSRCRHNDTKSRKVRENLASSSWGGGFFGMRKRTWNESNSHSDSPS